jgi:hypothetical protein
MILPDRTFVSDWIRDPRLRAQKAHVQLLLIFLRPLCDRYGRFEFNPALIHMALYVSAQCTNVSAQDVEAWLEILRSGGFIRTYTGSDGRRVGEIAKEYWRQKLSFGKAVFETDTGELPLADPPAEAPPPPAPPQEVKRREEKLAPASPPRPTAPAAGETVLYFSDRLILTMCELEGSDPAFMTAAHKRKVRAALTAIQRVQRDLLPADLEAAAAAYRKLFPQATLTAHALAASWGRLAGRTAPKSVVPLVEPEPPDWRAFVNHEFPASPYAEGNDKAGLPWHDVEAYVRRHIIASMQKAGLLRSDFLNHRPAA